MATLTTEWKSYASATWTGSSGAKVTFYLDARYSSQSIENNTTTIYTRLRSVLNVGSASGAGYNFTCSYCSPRSGSSVWTFATETIITSPATVIQHSSSGTKTLTLSATAKNTYLGINKSFSATVDLPKINRIATVTSATDFTDENNPSVSFNNPAGYLAEPFLDFLNQDGTTIGLQIRRYTGETPESPYNWELTNAERESIRSYLSNRSSATVRVGVRTTISGSYSYSYFNKTCSIVNAAPTISLAKEETNQDVIDILGTSASTIVKNISNVKLTATTTTLKSATTSKVSFTRNNETVDDPTSPYENMFIATNGSFSAKVYDSRGNTSTATNDSVLIEYEPVLISSINAKRVNPTSSNIRLKSDIKYYQIMVGTTENTPVIKWKFREEGEETQLTSSDYTIDTENNRLTIDTTLINALYYRQPGTLILTITDMFSSSTNNTNITKGIPTFDAGNTDFKVNGSLYIADTDGQNKKLVNEFVVEQGISNNWTYRKWASGLAECWGNFNVTGLNITTQSQGTYYGASETFDFPDGLFSQLDYGMVANGVGTHSSGLYPYDFAGSSNEYSCTVNFRAFSSQTNASCPVFIHAYGKWN